MSFGTDVPKIISEVDTTKSTVVKYDIMKVLQAAPIVHDKSDQLEPFPLFDYVYERDVLVKALEESGKIGKTIDVDFDIATTERIAAFLGSDNDCPLLHFSCHGNKKYLAIEGASGLMHPLITHQITDLFNKKLNENLDVVILSACDSLRAGEAIHRAGVKHVVCCDHDTNLQGSAAAVFFQSFYRTLAAGGKLKESFKLAKKAVELSPFVPNSEREASNFILLPKKSEEDPYHDVEVFYKRHIQRRNMTLSSTTLPPAPAPFEGRELVMHEVMRKLSVARLVQVVGDSDVGKSSLVRAVCNYLNDRADAFFVWRVVWLPPIQHHSKDTEETAILRSIFELILLDSQDFGSNYEDLRGKLVDVLNRKLVIIFIDMELVTSSTGRIEKLCQFLKDLFSGTQQVKVVSASRLGLEIPKQPGYTDSQIKLEPLDLEKSVSLFGTICPFVSDANNLVCRLVQKKFARQTRLDASMPRSCIEIFERVGGGLPGKICSAAASIDRVDYEELLGIGERMRRQETIDSRTELEKEIASTSEKLSVAVDSQDFVQAKDLNEILEDLQSLRGSIPSLSELKQIQRKISSDIASAESSRNYQEARQLKQKATDLDKKIELEQKNRMEIIVEDMEFIGDRQSANLRLRQCKNDEDRNNKFSLLKQHILTVLRKNPEIMSLADNKTDVTNELKVNGFVGFNLADDIDTCDLDWNNYTRRRKLSFESTLDDFVEIETAAKERREEFLRVEVSERAIVQISARSELRLQTPLPRKRTNRVEEIAKAIVDRLKRAGANENQLYQMAIGGVWGSNNYILLEAPECVFALLHSELIKAGTTLHLGSSNAILLIGMEPIFVVRGPFSIVTEKPFIFPPTEQEKCAEVLRWKKDDSIILIPTSARAFSKIVSGGIECKYWQDDNNSKWKDLPSIWNFEDVVNHDQPRQELNYQPRMQWRQCKLLLSISAKGLRKKQWLPRAPSTFAIVKMLLRRGGNEAPQIFLGHTELIRNNVNPSWSKIFNIDRYVFGEPVYIEIGVFHYRGNTKDGTIDMDYLSERPIHHQLPLFRDLDLRRRRSSTRIKHQVIGTALFDLDKVITTPGSIVSKALTLTGGMVLLHVERQSYET